MLDTLAAHGVKLAVCTNKLEALTHDLIDALGWNGRFAGIIGGDTLPQRKPDPAPVHEAVRRAGGGRAAFVGDSINDTDAARAAGLAGNAEGMSRAVAEVGAATADVSRASERVSAGAGAAAATADTAVGQAKAADRNVRELQTAAEAIGEAAQAIQAIAEQTNL